MKNNKNNKKGKIFGLGFLSFLLTAGAVATPLLLRNFSSSSSKINTSILEE